MLVKRPLGWAPTGVALCTPRRCETTGDSYSYKPGRIAKALRLLFTALTPRAAKERLALRMQKGMEKAEDLERQQMWLKKHGSPLQVMGLPDHAELPEVRARYRSLVLETHPDTAKPSNAGSSNALSTVRESEYDILQTAYHMAIDPNSLWHRNGAAPVLYRELQGLAKRRVGRVDRVRAFAVMTYAFMVLVGIFFATVVVKHALEVALQLFDPEFYQFMRAQEEEEKRKREAGEFVDVDPKRLAPTAVRKLLYPGRYIHGDSEETSANEGTDE